MIGRRGVLKGLAAFVAAAAIPNTKVEAFVAEAKQTPAVDYKDLPPGRYTFSAYVRYPGANWVRVERDYEHGARGPLNIDLLDLIERADRIIVPEGVVTTGPGPDHTQVAFLQVNSEGGAFGTLYQ